MNDPFNSLKQLLLFIDSITMGRKNENEKVPRVIEMSMYITKSKFIECEGQCTNP